MNQKTNSKSFVYVGAGSRIECFELQTNGSLRRCAETIFPGQSPGWFALDESLSRIFVPDGLGPNLSVYRFDASTGQLSLEATIPFVSHSVHLHIEKQTDGYVLAGASYDHARYGRGYLSKNLDVFEPIHTLRFDHDSKTHSSSFDLSRNLVYVSNLGDNRIHVYRVVESGLEKVAAIDIPNPRIVHYDSHFDRLYVSTEAYTERSYVKVYSMNEGITGDVILQETGSFEMALSGGDLKIDYRHGYLAATVREEGKEGLWLLPLKNDGHLDAIRDRHFVDLPFLKPRSLQVTRDGQFYVIACDDPKNKKDLVVVRAHFDGSGRHLVGAEIVESVKLNGAPNLANALIC